MIKDMLRGMYKSAQFFVRKETITALGLKQIVHEYPNTGIRYVETQGENAFSSSIELFFRNKLEFENFVATTKDELPGRLMLPVYGIVNNVKVIPYDVDIDYSRIGQYSLAVSFYETAERPSPTMADTTVSDAIAGVTLIMGLIKINFVGLFALASVVAEAAVMIATNITTASVLFSITKNKNISNNLKDNFQKNFNDPELLASYFFGSDTTSGLLTDIIDNVTDFTALKKIAVIGKNLPTEMYDINNKISLNYDIDNANIRDVDFSIALFTEDSTEAENRNHNRKLIINSFRLAGLLGMLQLAANTDYKTSDEISSVMSEIEYYFVNIIDNDTTGVLIDNIKNDLNIFKGKIFELLGKKQQSAYKNTSIKINDYMSATLLSYKMYGEYIKNSTDLTYYAELIRGLNKDKPAHLLRGEIQVLEIG